MDEQPKPVPTYEELLDIVGRMAAIAAEASAPRKLLLSQEEAMAYVGVAERSWYRLRSAGKVPPPVDVGGRQMWRRSDLDGWVAKLKPAKARRFPTKTEG